MDIILFLAGFLTGAILVAVIFTVVNSKGKNSTDALMKQMELYFENTANKIFEEIYRCGIVLKPEIYRVIDKEFTIEKNGGFGYILTLKN